MPLQFGPTISVLAADDCAAFGLRSPVFVEVEKEEGFVAKVLHPAGISSFGAGSSIQAAIVDLVDVMRAESASLRSRIGRLSVDMARELAVMDVVLAADGDEPVRPDVYVSAPIIAGATGPEFNTAPTRNSYIPFPPANTI